MLEERNEETDAKKEYSGASSKELEGVTGYADEQPQGRDEKRLARHGSANTHLYNLQDVPWPLSRTGPTG